MIWFICKVICSYELTKSSMLYLQEQPILAFKSYISHIFQEVDWQRRKASLDIGKEEEACTIQTKRYNLFNSWEMTDSLSVLWTSIMRNLIKVLIFFKWGLTVPCATYHIMPSCMLRGWWVTSTFFWHIFSQTFQISSFFRCKHLS